MTTTSNTARLIEGIDLYRDTLRRFLAQRLQSAYGKGRWVEDGLLAALPYGQQQRFRDDLAKQAQQPGILDKGVASPADVIDVQHIAHILRRSWELAFRIALKDQKKAIDWAKEIGDERNTWAHKGSGDLRAADVNRILDSCARVLALVDPAAAAKVEALRDAGTRSEDGGVRSEERGGRSEERRAAGEERGAGSEERGARAEATPTPAHSSLLDTHSSVKGLPAWRAVISPHPDVAAGRYQQAEFAADLAQVLQGKAEAEYQDPVEFFRRTYLTAGMQRLLAAAIERLAGEGGDPVVELKTSFGGGKTHSMLALYHLVTAGPKVAALPGLAPLLADRPAPQAAIAVLVGTALDPAKPSRLCAGLQAEVNTLWGEMAYQLGWSRPGLANDAAREQAAAEAFRVVLDSDAKGTAPGSNTLVELFEQVGPCAILVDELVAFMRNIRGAKGLRGGDFNANMTFVQNLTEAVKRSPRAVLVASIPESRIELGDASGEEVARRIENTFGRLEAVWQPVAPHEGFEVVRRRLFGPVGDEAGRDATCRAFASLYRDNGADFPVEARSGEYYDRLVASYPIHPELFERLYNDWSTLERFQRTRGVLRLMAAAIHELWQAVDQSPLIMPGSLPLYAPRVRNELTRYIGDQWNAIVDADVDGDGSEPRRIDGGERRFGEVAAARRLARTIFLGSAPGSAAGGTGRRGIEEVRIRLGAVQPGESVAVYNDALGRLRDRLSHLYSTVNVDGSGGRHGTYWYAVHTNLNRTVADRASRVDDDTAYRYLEGLLKGLTQGSARRGAQGAGGDERVRFAGVHLAPPSSADVPDEDSARLVVLSPRQTPVAKADARTTTAGQAAQEILDHRGAAPRLRRNMLVFLAADGEVAANALAEAKQQIAWQSIVDEADQLNLDQGQRRQAQQAAESAARGVAAKLDEAYKWILVPTQEGTQPQGWEVLQPQSGTLGSSGTPVERAAHTLGNQELLIGKWGHYLLKLELDRYLWKDGQPYLSTKQLWDYLTQYLYLPRLRDRTVLEATIAGGCRLRDFFGYADGVDASGRFLGLRYGEPAPTIYINDQSVIVRPEAAQAQLDAEAAQRQPERTPTTGVNEVVDQPYGGQQQTITTGNRDITPHHPLPAPVTRRYYGRVQLDNLKLASNARQVFDEVVQHLTGLLGADVRVTIEIDATVADGIPDTVVRTITENGRALKFEASDFAER